MVDPESGEPVSLNESRKAFAAEPGLYVVVTREEIERSAPAPTREVRVTQFAPLDTLDPQLFDRPYFMGPGTDSVDDYFALVQAVARHKCAGSQPG